MNELSGQTKLRLVEIFSAIQGEGIYVGERQLFVRLGGCNLRCVYCFAPTTRVLMADLTWRTIADVQEGDMVIGFDKPARYNHFRMRPACVLHKFHRPAAAVVRVVTDQGEVICTSDHRFWHCTKGIRPIWKQARSMKAGNRIRFVASPYQHEETPEFIRGWLAGMAAGDGCFWNLPRRKSCRRFRLALKDEELLDVFSQRAQQLGFDLYRAPHACKDFNGHRKQMQALWLTSHYRCVAFEQALQRVGDADYARGWLGGFFDAEGTYSGYVQFTQAATSPYLRVACEHLTDLGFPYVLNGRGVRLQSTVAEAVRFFSECAPVLQRKVAKLYGVAPRTVATVIAVEPVGESEVYNLATETHNYVAEGFLVKNCDQPETLDATQIPRYRVEQTAGKRNFVWRDNLATVADVLDAVERLDQPRGLHGTVSITGGEPLLQPSGLRALLPMLRERGYRIYCDTNGMLPQHAARVADLIDVVAMDIKLPSSTGEPPFWKEHEEFLKVFEPSQVFAKVVVDENFTWEEMENVCRVIQSRDESIPLILQPVTPFAASGNPPSPDVVLELQAFCKRFLPDVRVIPQTHKITEQL